MRNENENKDTKLLAVELPRGLWESILGVLASNRRLAESIAEDKEKAQKDASRERQVSMAVRLMESALRIAVNVAEQKVSRDANK